jgi:hypothetical protein
LPFSLFERIMQASNRTYLVPEPSKGGEMPEPIDESQLRRTVRRVLKPTIDSIIDDAVDWVKASQAATDVGADEATQGERRREASVRSEALRGQLISAEVLGDLREAADQLTDQPAEAGSRSRPVPAKRGRVRAA